MFRILVAGYPDRTINYCEALKDAGMEPITYPDAAYADAGSLSDSFDGLLLPGGGDIDPALFGEKNYGSNNIDRNLDLIQFSLLDRFVKSAKPVLGICKGMQLINVCFGGGMIQHLKTAPLHTWQEGDRIHSVIASDHSVLRRLYGASFTVNSAHHQGIGRPGRELRITLHSVDGVPEALEHSALPILGVQFHPERMCGRRARQDTIDGAKIFRYFKELAEKSTKGSLF